MNIDHMRGMVFDIETIPQPRTLAMDPPEEFLLKGSRSNYKPETLEAHKEAQAKLWPEEQVKAGSLDWRRGRVLSYGAGWWKLDRNGPYRRIEIGIVGPLELADLDIAGFFDGKLPPQHDIEILPVTSEAELLENFWSMVYDERHRPQVGFACRDFDCPWVLFRSAVNGVRPTWVWQGGRYTFNGSRADLIDLCDLLSWFGKFEMRGWNLSQYCEHFGVAPLPRGSGADIYELAQAGNWAAIIEHQLFDVLATLGLYQLFSGVVE